MIYYVDLNSGDDTNGGTSNTDAWLTLSHANDNSVDGDTIRMVDGTYLLSSSEIWYLIGNRIYDSETPNGFVIDGNLADNGGVVPFPIKINVDTVDKTGSIAGWKFYQCTGPSPYNGAGMIAPNTGITTGKMSVKSCFFDDCTISGANGTGGLLYYYKTVGAGDPSISEMDGCLFRNLHTRQDSLYANNRASLQVYGKMDLKNCTFIKDKTFTYENEEILLSQTAGTSPGIITVDRCIFYNLTGATKGIFYSTDSRDNTTITHSDWKGYQGNYIPLNDGVDGNLVAETNPLMVDAINGNYELRPSSPCFID